MTLKFIFIDLAIPAAYVNFAVAASVFGALVHAINYMLLNEFVRVTSNKLFRFDAPWALTVLQDGGNAWSIGVLKQFRFFQSSMAHGRLGKATMLLANLPFLAVLLVVYWIIFSVGSRVLFKEGLLSSSGVFTVISWLLVLYPLCYIALLRTPFSFSKNTTFIRWNFLTRMYRRSGFWPPRVSEWLAEKKTKEKTPVATPLDGRAAIEAKNEARTAELRKKYGPI